MRGILDDLLLIPLGVTLAFKLIPLEIIEQSRKEAEVIKTNKSLEGKIAAGIIIVLWIVIIFKTIKIIRR